MRCIYQYKYFVVKSDENLIEFCKRNHLNFSDVRLLNNITEYKNSLLGQKIKLPSELCCCKNGFFYRIKANESIKQICDKHKVSIYDFFISNPYFNIKSYTEGQIIIIPFN